MLISFILYTIFMSYTPGPNNLLALDGSLRFGFKGTKRFLFGIGLGFLSLSIICLVFSTYLTLYFKNFVLLIKILGFIYLLYLAFSVFKSHEKGKDNRSCYRLRDGLYLQYMNPKTIVYVLTAIVSYATVQSSSYFMMISYTLIIALIGVSGAIAWSLMGLCFKQLLSKYNTQYKIIMSASLVILACMMLFE
ncbi:LysE family transporter [Staphylococcus gallinarum]|uniref:LysE family transporter n=1 Tax=Staphylococcus gallinarum TaxID=1293 RepID=UPI001E58522D|nr:LysE family transporter [Staphylococcus gallinarum]MCD8918162.1 LysE family transporter [Staphylococcus gallinarum]